MDEWCMLVLSNIDIRWISTRYRPWPHVYGHTDVYVQHLSLTCGVIKLAPLMSNVVSSAGWRWRHDPSRKTLHWDHRAVGCYETETRLTSTERLVAGPEAAELRPLVVPRPSQLSWKCGTYGRSNDNSCNMMSAALQWSTAALTSWSSVTFSVSRGDGGFETKPAERQI